MDILRIETTNISITSVYKLLLTPFNWEQNFTQNNKAAVTIGDFNSHSCEWGYNNTNEDSLAVKEWAAYLNLSSTTPKINHPSTEPDTPDSTSERQTGKALQQT